MSYYVICKSDTFKDGEYEYGKYVLATSRSFTTFEKAEYYSEAIAPDREPKILMEVTALDKKP